LVVEDFGDEVMGLLHTLFKQTLLPCLNGELVLLHLLTGAAVKEEGGGGGMWMPVLGVGD
jgi:hypothetical protein